MALGTDDVGLVGRMQAALGTDEIGVPGRTQMTLK
jgi:hypothetical protein